jgi:hypothetical protein
MIHKFYQHLLSSIIEKYNEGEQSNRRFLLVIHFSTIPNNYYILIKEYKIVI